MPDDLSALTDHELLQRHVAGDGGAAFGELDLPDLHDRHASV